MYIKVVQKSKKVKKMYIVGSKPKSLVYVIPKASFLRIVSAHENFEIGAYLMHHTFDLHTGNTFLGKVQL